MAPQWLALSPHSKRALSLSLRSEPFCEEFACSPSVSHMFQKGVRLIGYSKMCEGLNASVDVCFGFFLSQNVSPVMNWLVQGEPYLHPMTIG